MMEVMDVIQTSEVQWRLKSISSVFAVFSEMAQFALFRKYGARDSTAALATRITKIHTSSSACVVGLLHGQQNECDSGPRPVTP